MKLYPVMDDDEGRLVTVFSDEAIAGEYVEFACSENGYSVANEPDPTLDGAMCPYYIASCEGTQCILDEFGAPDKWQRAS